MDERLEFEFTDKILLIESFMMIKVWRMFWGGSGSDVECGFQVVASQNLIKLFVSDRLKG
jgi:hypothetical protein